MSDGTPETLSFRDPTSAGLPVPAPPFAQRIGSISKNVRSRNPSEQTLATALRPIACFWYVLLSEAGLENLVGHLTRIEWGNQAEPGFDLIAPGFERIARAGYDDLGMRQHSEWWEAHRDRLDWQTIDTYRLLPGSADMGEIVVLRAGDRWTYGWLMGGEWCRFAEGGSYALETFTPTHWAEVSVEDAMLLSAE